VPFAHSHNSRWEFPDFAKAMGDEKSPLPNILFRVYNAAHAAKPQPVRRRSSRRYKRVIQTCHGLRLNEETQVPQPTGSGLFLFSTRLSTFDLQPANFQTFNLQHFILHPSSFILSPWYNSPVII